MTEQPAEYVTDALEMMGAGYAAEIESPRTVKVLSDDGLKDYKMWGWVKVSANFISHIKRLKGAKLAIWQVIALSIDETGKCRLTIKELEDITGYSHTEILSSIKELAEMGYMGVDKTNKGNIYSPEFAARGSENPSKETLLKKVESTPVYQDESTPPLENPLPSYRELKELKNHLSEKDMQDANKKMDAILEQERQAQEKQAEGKGWRGRELLSPDYIFYGDLWHRLTGLEMYGAKAKAKMDTEWLKAFKDCFENEVSESAFCEAYVRETWEGRRAVGKPSMIVATAKAIQAANKKVESTITKQGQGFYA